MSIVFSNCDHENELPIWCVSEDLNFPKQLPLPALNWAKNQNFQGRIGDVLILPNEDGTVLGALLGMGCPGLQKDYDRLFVTSLRTRLSCGVWYFANSLPEAELQLLALAFSSYRFTNYKKSRSEKETDVILKFPKTADVARFNAWVESHKMASDLILSPSNVLNPAGLEDVFISLSKKFNAELNVIRGKDLLEYNFPLIYAVGNNSDPEQSPRLLDLKWGDPKGKKITLIGKGVCFDSGGLNIKSAPGMLSMKKDMGGAANVLALGYMIMAMQLPVRLRLLVPAVNNLITEKSYRPGDIFISRKGLSVEIGNTDAEGRLILADCLSYADEEEPDFLFDLATLTGSARIALGAELVPFFTNCPDFLKSIVDISEKILDPVWPMPLWSPYRSKLHSSFADINNVGKGGYAGSIVAALFLQNFVEKAKVWSHFDLFCGKDPFGGGHPMGGELQAVRALFSFLQKETSKTEI